MVLNGGQPRHKDRLWIVTYNIPRKFDNGIRWVAVNVRLFGWRQLGGVWWSKRWPFVRLIRPGGSAYPIGWF